MWQKYRVPLKKRYTCDKNKVSFLEVNFCESKKCLKKHGFHSVFRVLCVFEKKEGEEEDVVADQDFPRTLIIYYKYS